MASKGRDSSARRVLRSETVVGVGWGVAVEGGAVEEEEPCGCLEAEGGEGRQDVSKPL